MKQFLRDAKKAKSIISNLSGEVKNNILLQMSEALLGNALFIIRENMKDYSLFRSQYLSYFL